MNVHGHSPSKHQQFPTVGSILGTTDLEGIDSFHLGCDADHVIDDEKWKIINYNRKLPTFDSGPIRFFRNSTGQKPDIDQGLNVKQFLELSEERT
ncbi:hypothetical protein DASC09_009140 [Saccharomycopsis crataegensis]|uniref:Uncharacterized protein n=1 Tax=Saccharomycopsis crataegensis TaxID=43959 RepID=A0AAV5QFZ8_9ASCO|nr:hypothetical protein DASC09_009140 [Saccharomycopsis crataegensis]